MATDFSESAVHATNSQQLEDFSKLAILTTFLLYSMMTMQMTLNHAPVLLTHIAAQAAARVPLRVPQATITSLTTTRPSDSMPILLA